MAHDKQKPKDELAEEGRAVAVEQADQVADDDSEGRRGSHAEMPKGPFTLLHAMVRSGEPKYPGDPVSFEAHEAEHVSDLLAQRILIQGKPGDDAVDEALKRADLARGRAQVP